MSDIDFKNYSGCIDTPDKRDFQAEELFGAIPEITLPKRVILDFTPVLNQGAIGACTVFGSSSALFETEAQHVIANNLQYTQSYDPWTVWAEAKKRGASDSTGWIIQAALQLIKDMKHSSGYVKIGDSRNADVYTLKYWLSTNKCIVTGSSYGDWGKIVETGIYSESKKQAGHCFALNGYDDEYVFPDGSKGAFHCANTWGGRGSFWMKYSDVKVLFTQYYEVGNEDIDALRKIAFLKDQRNFAFAEQARQRGIWSGDRPNDFATDTELSIMLYRTQRASDRKMTRQAWADVIQASVLRGKADFKFWSGNEANKIATDREIALMFTRAVTRDPNTVTLSLTRQQAAAVIGRDF